MSVEKSVDELFYQYLINDPVDMKNINLSYLFAIVRLVYLSRKSPRQVLVSREAAPRWWLEVYPASPKFRPKFRDLATLACLRLRGLAVHPRSDLKLVIASLIFMLTPSSSDFEYREGLANVETTCSERRASMDYSEKGEAGY